MGVELRATSMECVLAVRHACYRARVFVSNGSFFFCFYFFGQVWQLQKIRESNQRIFANEKELSKRFRFRRARHE